MLSNYFSKRRGLDLWNIATVIQAACATSAATTFFDPVKIGEESFVDGATGANNPIYEIWTEAADVWRDSENWRLEDHVQCVISIGTGMPSLKPFGDNLMSIGSALIGIATKTEEVAEVFRKVNTALFSNKRAFRFNVTRGLESIGLEDAAAVGAIQAATRNHIQTEDVFKQLEACGARLKESECRS